MFLSNSLTEKYSLNRLTVLGLANDMRKAIRSTEIL